VENEIRALYRPLDPSSAQVGPEAQEADLAGILRDGRVHQSEHQWSRRRVVLAGAATAGVMMGAAVVGEHVLGNRSGSDRTETPVPPAHQPPAEPKSAPGALEALADRVAPLPSDVGTGTCRRITTVGWYLDSQLVDGVTTSALGQRRVTTWLAADGSGRQVAVDQPYQFASERDRERWLGGTSPGKHVYAWKPEKNWVIWKTPAPTETAALAKWLRTGHPVSNGPMEVLQAVADLYREQVLVPGQRAALLRVLASVPGLRYVGAAKDRTGRPGKAFTLVDSHGVPTRYTMIIDADSGALLSFEQALIRDAAGRKVRTPAITEYEAYVDSRYVSAVGK
jgi:hypothetical protein